MTGAGRLDYCALSSEDFEAVLALYRIVRDRSAPGSLASKEPAEFEALLADPTTTAVGVRHGDDLVGYALYATEEPFGKARAFLSRFGVEHAPVAISRGIAIHPDYQNRSIGQELIGRLQSILSERLIKHAFSVIFHANWASLIIRLRSGAALVDHVIDEDGLNFLVYIGPLTTRFACVHSAVGMDDTAEQRRQFIAGHAVTACRLMPSSDERKLVLSFSAPDA